jgi:enolase
MNKITNVKAREIIDCRGWPTVQVDVWVDGFMAGRADVPQGRSTGTYEAHVLLGAGFSPAPDPIETLFSVARALVE